MLEEIKQLKQWVCWRGDKRPKNPHTGFEGSTTNPNDWGTYNEAVQACKRFGFDGVGFVFKKDGCYFGVDLDHCIDKKSFCDEFVKGLQSYNEISRSGTGLHILCKGALPEGARRKGGVEMYSEGRYFIVTQNIYNPAYTDIADFTERIKPLHRKYLYTPKEKKPPVSVDFGSVPLHDFEIIELAGKSSRSGVKFNILWGGNWQLLYNSHSEADLALCGILAFWSNNDYSTIDRLFRCSGLMREKWDECHGVHTYGQMTINKALGAK